MSDDCFHCVCSSVSLYGRVLSDMNKTIENAQIFLESGKYKPMTTTNRLGLFKVDGLCLLGETIRIVANGYSDAVGVPIAVNETHWSLPDVTLETYSECCFFRNLLVKKEKLQPRTNTHLKSFHSFFVREHISVPIHFHNIDTAFDRMKTSKV